MPDDQGFRPVRRKAEFRAKLIREPQDLPDDPRVGPGPDPEDQFWVEGPKWKTYHDVGETWLVEDEYGRLRAVPMMQFRQGFEEVPEHLHRDLPDAPWQEPSPDLPEDLQPLVDALDAAHDVAPEECKACGKDTCCPRCRVFDVIQHFEDPAVFP